ncbi:TetR/AcrR family transcriptional regulator [Micromonospora coxensis]|uniref:TetR/AcrR family transcriptional regulator n=1 Tax=Micromonospora coxensis TaxID=356852 RepID=UPI00343E7902
MTRPRRTAGDRIVEAAIARIHERGISVGLDGISLEEAIAASGVSRATAYRHWPNRTEFLREVLVRVVRDAHLEPEGTEELDAIRTFVQTHRRQIATDAGRRTVAVESLRIAVEADFRRLAESREWRDYLALTATCRSLPEGELRTTVTAELAAAEHSFVTHRATVYSRLPQLLGYRLVPPLTGGAGFEVMAEAMGALMTGLVVRATTARHPAPFRARAFGSSVEAEWTSTSYALVAAVLSYLEPDPSIEWDAERIAATIARFQDLAEVIEVGRGRPRSRETTS